MLSKEFDSVLLWNILEQPQTILKLADQKNCGFSTFEDVENMIQQFWDSSTPATKPIIKNYEDHICIRFPKNDVVFRIYYSDGQVNVVYIDVRNKHYITIWNSSRNKPDFPNSLIRIVFSLIPPSTSYVLSIVYGL